MQAGGPIVEARRPGQRKTWLALWCGLSLAGLAYSNGVPAYLEGQTARADVLAPVAIKVVDPDKTEQLRQEAATKIPTVYRFKTETVLAAETALQESFSRHRQRFWGAMEQAARRPKLDLATVQHPSFFRFIGWFRQQYPGFPLTTNLATAWALHESDEPFQSRWVGYLREAMNQCIVPEPTVSSKPSGSTLVRVVSPSPGAQLTPRMVETVGVTLRASDLLSPAEAKARLAASLGNDPESLTVFLGGFIRVNCFPDEELTRTIRQQAVANILAIDHYEAGQVIVRRGERIDAKMKVALDLLRTNLGGAGESQPAGADHWTGMRAGLKKAWMWTASHPLALEKTALLSLWLLAVISLLSIGLLAWLVRQRRLRRPLRPVPAVRDLTYTVVLNPQQNETVFLPMRPTTEAADPAQDTASPEENGTSKPVLSLSERFWHERALAAERRAEEILAMVRAGLAPQLARQMMHKLVQELISQRAQWLQTQRIAEQDLALLEQRFTEAHDHLVGRLRSFEKRTEELERALAMKAAENTELIKAHIALTQKQIQNKSSGTEAVWN